MAFNYIPCELNVYVINGLFGAFQFFLVKLKCFLLYNPQEDQCRCSPQSFYELFNRCLLTSCYYFKSREVFLVSCFLD